MKKTDPRTIKTKKKLKDALKEEILEKDSYLDIKISDICNRAKVSRRTFYTHYKTIDDIILEIQVEVTNDYMRRTKGINLVKDVRKNIETLFHFLDSDPFYERLMFNPSHRFLMQALRKKSIAQINRDLSDLNKYDQFTKDAIMSFYNSATYVIYQNWYQQNKKEPIEKVINIAANLVEKGFSFIL